jgi:CO/xanthine dehydrogenase Mo-binding subunit
VTTLSFGDYKMPTVVDMPELVTVVLESARGEGPYNIRGIGEAPCIPVAPAIADAVEHRLACGYGICQHGAEGPCGFDKPAWSR